MRSSLNETGLSRRTRVIPKAPYVGVFVLGLAALMLLLPGCTEQPTPGPTVKTPVPAPKGTLEKLELQSLTGNSPDLTLEDLKGQVVLLNIWGPWCPPCRKELPHLAEIGDKYAYNPNFRLLPVSYPYNYPAPDRKAVQAEQTRQLLADMNIDGYATWYDQDQVTLNAIRGAVGFQGYPTTLLIDQQGQIRQVWAFYAPGLEQEMDSMVQELLGEEAAK